MIAENIQSLFILGWFSHFRNSGAVGINFTKSHRGGPLVFLVLLLGTGGTGLVVIEFWLLLESKELSCCMKILSVVWSDCVDSTWGISGVNWLSVGLTLRGCTKLLSSNADALEVRGSAVVEPLAVVWM